MDSQIVKQAKAEGLLQPLEPAKVAVPADPSSAAFPLVANCTAFLIGI